MRGNQLLDSLFSKARRQILGALMLDAGRAWSLTDIAKLHGTTPSTLQRELVTLQECGLVVRYELGGQVLYRANAGCECFPELQALFVRAFSFVEQLREALAKFAIRTAFVYGNSVWGGSHDPIELVIVAESDAAALDLAIRPLEIRLGRLIDVALLKEDEFARRLREGDYFLKSVLDSASLTVIGEDLAAAA